MSLRSIISAETAPGKGITASDGKVNLEFGSKYTLVGKHPPIPLVISGVVGVKIEGASGTISSGVFRANSIAGESLTRQREQHDIKTLIAIRDSVIVPIPREDILDILDTERELRRLLVGALSSDARRLEEAALIFTRRGVNDRLGFTILGITGEEGGEIGLVNEDLGFFASVSRPKTSVQLGIYERIGILTNDGTGYSVPKVGIRALRIMATCGDDPFSAFKAATEQSIERPTDDPAWHKILT